MGHCRQNDRRFFEIRKERTERFQHDLVHNVGGGPGVDVGRRISPALKRPDSCRACGGHSQRHRLDVAGPVGSAAFQFGDGGVICQIEPGHVVRRHRAEPPDARRAEERRGRAGEDVLSILVDVEDAGHCQPVVGVTIVASRFLLVSWRTCKSTPDTTATAAAFILVDTHARGGI